MLPLEGRFSGNSADAGREGLSFDYNFKVDSERSPDDAHPSPEKRRQGLAMLSIFINVLLVLHVLVCFLIVLAVLMQRPKNEGLGAAFGAGMTDSLFGAQTTNVLASITRWLGVFFFVLTLVLSALYARQGRMQTKVQKNLEQSAQPLFTTPVVDPGSLSAPAPSDAPKADVPKADAPKADAPKADAPKADAPKADAPKADAPKADAPKADAPKADAPKADAPKADAPKADAPKADAPKADAPKADAPKADAPKADAPKADAPKADAPKADAPKADAPKADAPKADAPKADAPKADAPKADAGETPRVSVPLRAQPDRDLVPAPVPSGGKQ